MKRTSLPYRNINPHELSEFLQNRKDTLLLDVREPFELAAFGALPGVTNISMRELVPRLKELPADKTRPIVAICQSGTRSQEVARYLTAQGYTDVYNLAGGTLAWISAGQPVSRGGR